MKGFRINYNGITYYATLPLPIISVEISNKSTSLRMNISGMDKSGLNYQWYAGKMHPGDEIEITYGDFEECPSEVIVLDIRDEDIQNRLMLEEYYDLKKELEAEGLI